jgi:hypothetical protein
MSVQDRSLMRDTEKRLDFFWVKTSIDVFLCPFWDSQSYLDTG